MNSLISLLFLWQWYNASQERLYLSNSSRLMVALGAITPLVDYVQVWLFEGICPADLKLPFHSLFYQHLFWFALAGLLLLIFRDGTLAIKCLLPLLGLWTYFSFSLLSTERLPFFLPFTSETLNFNLVKSGYLVLILGFGLMVLVKIWANGSTQSLAKGFITVLCLFMASMLVSRFLISQLLPPEFKESKEVLALPDDLFQIRWKVTARYPDHYLLLNYHVLNGWEGEAQELENVSDAELSQVIFTDPQVTCLCRYLFQNAVVNARLQNESMRVELKELFGLHEIFWTKEVVLIKNSSGHIVDQQAEFHFF